MISYQVLQGDSYDVLHSLSKNPEQRGKYRIIVTSPPYFLCRHYGRDLHEIGQEKTAEIFIDEIVSIESMFFHILNLKKIYYIKSRTTITNAALKLFQSIHS
jgi:hypothetical protein